MNPLFWLIVAGLLIATGYVVRLAYTRRPTWPFLLAVQAVAVLAMLGFGITDPRHRAFSFMMVMIGLGGIYRRARTVRA